MRIYVEEASRHDEPGRARLAQMVASGQGIVLGSHVFVDVTDAPMPTVTVRPCAVAVYP